MTADAISRIKSVFLLENEWFVWGGRGDNIAHTRRTPSWLAEVWFYSSVVNLAHNASNR